MGVSVVIPTYNRAQLLGRALHSVLKQSCDPDELIVVDDGSTDGTQNLISDRFPDVCYIWQQNRGISSARNRGIAESKHEWIAFLDSDDEWLPQKLECQISKLQQQPSFRLCHTDEIWIRNGKRVNPLQKHRKFDGHIFRRCLPLCVISPSSVIIHRTIFDEVGLFDEALPACEDYDMWLRICAKYPVLFINQQLIKKYGGHQDQLSRKHWGMDRFRIRALEKMLKLDELSAEDRAAVLTTLLQKMRIVVQGARKHARYALLAQMVFKQRLYQQLIHDYQLPQGGAELPVG